MKSVLAVDPGHLPIRDHLDFMYAAVESATVNTDTPHRYSVSLEGRLTNTCLKLRKPKVIATGKTIQILPVMDLLKPTPGTVCRRMEKPFNVTVELPEPAKPGRYLVHVRSLNGQAVNEVFQRTR